MIVSDQPPSFNCILHLLHSRLNLKIDQAGVEVRHRGEMDRLLLQRGVISEAIPHILVDVLGEEGCDGRHQGRCVKQHVEQGVQGVVLVDCVVVVAFHAGTVKSHIPISEVFDKVKSWSYYIV